MVVLTPWTLKSIHYFRIYSQSKDGATILEHRRRRSTVGLEDEIHLADVSISIGTYMKGSDKLNDIVKHITDICI